MTQKRGLGRGLGALIPGAGSAPAPEQELRTRNRPQSEQGSGAANPRPVDMFFSGEKVSSDDSPQRGADGARDLAAGMARAAAERRGRTAGRGGANGTAKRASSTRSTTSAEAAEGSGAPSAKSSSSTKTAAGTGTAGTKTAAGAKSASAPKSGSAAKGAAASKSSTTAKGATAGKGATATKGSTAEKSTSAAKDASSSTSTGSTRGSGTGRSTGTRGGAAAKSASAATGAEASKGSTTSKRSTPAKATGSAAGSVSSKGASTAKSSSGTQSTPATKNESAAKSTTAAKSAPAAGTSAPEEQPTSSATAPDAEVRSTPETIDAAPRTEAATDTAVESADTARVTEESPSTAPQGAQADEATDEDPRGEESPVVDVETIEYTPVREDRARAADGEDAETRSTGAEVTAAPGAEDVVTEESAPAADPVATPSEEGDHAQDTPAEHAPADEASGTGEGSAAEDDEAPRESQGLLSVPGAEFAEIPIHEVRENPRNPRTMFDEDELDELAYSLREVGVLQPVVVRPIPVTEDGESFELVMGERRWRAARRAGLTAIPAIIRETSDDDLLRDALLENLHRTQLNPLEEANAYQQLLDDFGCTQDELGERIGRSRPQITNTLRLLRLPALVQRRLASGAISAGHARALLSLDDPTLMEELAQRIVSEGLSVRAVERLVARGGEQQGTRTVRRSTYDPHVVDLTSRLSNRLEAPVRIDVGKRKGKITLEFTNLEDLERLIENMGLDVPLPD
jgi:ParB family chromosome partitioning protein